MDLCWQLMSLLFNMLSRLVITFLPSSKHLLVSQLHSLSAVILEPPKIKFATVSPSMCHEVMGPLSFSEVPGKILFLRYGRKWRRMKEPLDESEKGEWKSWLKAQHSENKDHGIQSHHFMANRWGNSGNSGWLYFLGSKITADGDCSHEIKRRLLLGRKVMTNLESILKSRDIILSTKVHLVKATFFQWSCMDVRVGLWRKLSAKELMLLDSGVREDSWESLGLQGDPTSPS